MSVACLSEIPPEVDMGNIGPMSGTLLTVPVLLLPALRRLMLRLMSSCKM
jgi:hypothetical protein